VRFFSHLLAMLSFCRIYFSVLVYFGIISSFMWILSNLREFKKISSNQILKKTFGFTCNTYLSGLCLPLHILKIYSLKLCEVVLEGLWSRFLIWETSPRCVTCSWLYNYWVIESGVECSSSDWSLVIFSAFS